jgi:hypothetical protein
MATSQAYFPDCVCSIESRSSSCSDPPPREDVETFSTWRASVFVVGDSGSEARPIVRDIDENEEAVGVVED